MLDQAAATTDPHVSHRLRAVDALEPERRIFSNQPEIALVKLILRLWEILLSAVLLASRVNSCGFPCLGLLWRLDMMDELWILRTTYLVELISQEHSWEIEFGHVMELCTIVVVWVDLRCPAIKGGRRGGV